jgi:hypothetical protein
VTTKRISVRVSSLARARSSHRANKNCRESAPAAAAARAEPKPHGIPAATPKRFSHSPSKKRSRVTAPGRTVFNSPRARPLSPPRSVPNCKQTGTGKGGAVAPPNSFDQETQNCPIQRRANDGRGADAPHFNGVRNGGLILARNAPSIVQPICACQCIARPVPSALHIDSARQAWGLCF